MTHASEALRALEALKAAYGGDASARKRVLLASLERSRLSSAAAVLLLHELLAFLQAYPDDPAVLSGVERLLGAFDRRRDLVRHRKALANSGVAGTETTFAFYAPTARWLVSRWASRLSIDWKSFGRRSDLDRLLPFLTLYAETPGLDELDLGLRGWVDALKGRDETDAAFVVRRFGALRLPDEVRDLLYEGLELPLVLAAGRDPSRTGAKLPGARMAFQDRPLDRTRPDLRVELRRPLLGIRSLPRREAGALIDAARVAMVTRSRDLDVFEHASLDDVRLADCGDGLAFAVIGARAERRLLLESVYGLLTLKNGVPIGYVLASALFGSCEIAYNVFETFRGGEAARVYGRALATAARMFHADSFTIFPYQLGGYDNPEALASGAFWFYRKLGFAPKDRAVETLMRREEGLIRRSPAHRSPLGTLKVLGTQNLYFHAGRKRDDVIGLVELPNAGLAVTRAVAARFGSDRSRAARALSTEAAALLRVRTFSGWSAAERLWWDRWAPLVTILPGVAGWTIGEKRALVSVIRAKGGRRESDYVRLFDRHRRLRKAVVALSKEPATPD